MRHAALALTVMSLAGIAAEAQEARPTALPQTVRLHLRNQDTVQGYLRGRSKDEVVIFTSAGPVSPRAPGRGAALRGAQPDGQPRQARRGHRRRRLDRGGRGRLARISRQMGRHSWQSGAILAGSVGLGTLVGSRVPRYGWRPTEASGLTSGAASARTPAHASLLTPRRGHPQRRPLTA